LFARDTAKARNAVFNHPHLLIYKVIRIESSHLGSREIPQIMYMKDEPTGNITIFLTRISRHLPYQNHYFILKMRPIFLAVATLLPFTALGASLDAAPTLAAISYTGTTERDVEPGVVGKRAVPGKGSC
jgi:hypothetical protein